MFVTLVSSILFILLLSKLLQSRRVAPPAQ